MIPFMLFAALAAGGEHTEYLLTPMTVVYDPDITEDGDWFGVFLTDSGCELKEVDLELVPQMSSGDPFERPAGTFVTIPGETDEPLFILRSTETRFIPGPLTSFLYSGELYCASFSLRYGACAFFSIPGSRETRLYTTWDGLFITDGEITQHLSDTKPTESNFSFMSIVWAGDLDRDGRVDLLLNDVRDSYEIYHWYLFLSTEAGPDELLGSVASCLDVYY